jgi:hypothetical protein
MRGQGILLRCCCLMWRVTVLLDCALHGSQSSGACLPACLPACSPPHPTHTHACVCWAVCSERARGVLRDACSLAPLHNPPALYCIDAAQELFSDAPHVRCLPQSLRVAACQPGYQHCLLGAVGGCWAAAGQQNKAAHGFATQLPAGGGV